VMPKKSQVIEQLDFLTDRISTQVRTVSLGVLALTWGLIVGESGAAKSVSQQWKTHLVGIGALAILVMFLDFLQYVAGYWNILKLREKMNKCGLEEAPYDEKALSWRLRLLLFYTKQCVLVVAVMWLLYVLIRWGFTHG
jgi:hypothetical protein